MAGFWDPLALGIQSAANSLSGAYVQRAREQKQQEGIQNLMNLLNPEMNEQNAQQRFQQGLPLLQGQVGPTGEVGTAAPNLPPNLAAMYLQHQMGQQLNPLQQQQLEQGGAAFPLQQQQAVENIALTKAQADRAATPAQIPVSNQLHNMALNLGFMPGTKEYDVVTKGPSATREPQVPVSRLLHEAAIRAGNKIGSKGYHDFVNGPAKETLADKRLDLYGKAIAAGDTEKAYRVLGVKPDDPEEYKQDLNTAIKALKIAPDKKIELFQELAGKYPDMASKSKTILLPSMSFDDFILAAFGKQR